MELFFKVIMIPHTREKDLVSIQNRDTSCGELGPEKQHFMCPDGILCYPIIQNRL